LGFLKKRAVNTPIISLQEVVNTNSVRPVEEIRRLEDELRMIKEANRQQLRQIEDAGK
jgi:hypothetical protein